MLQRLVSWINVLERLQRRKFERRVEIRQEALVLIIGIIAKRDGFVQLGCLLVLSSSKGQRLKRCRQSLGSRGSGHWIAAVFAAMNVQKNKPLFVRSLRFDLSAQSPRFRITINVGPITSDCAIIGCRRACREAADGAVSSTVLRASDISKWCKQEPRAAGLSDRVDVGLAVALPWLHSSEAIETSIHINAQKLRTDNTAKWYTTFKHSCEGSVILNLAIDLQQKGPSHQGRKIVPEIRHPCPAYRQQRSMVSDHRA